MNSKKTKAGDQVENLLEKTVGEIRAAYPDILDRISKAYDLSLHQILRSKEEYAAAVLADHTLKSLARGWIQLAGNGHAVDTHALPAILLRRVLLGSSPQSVLEEFRAFASDGCSGATWYAALAGVSVKSSVALSETADLISWDQVPDDSPKRHYSLARDISPLEGLSTSPNSAIRIRLPSRKVFFNTATQVEDLEMRKREIVECHEIGADIQRALTLSAGIQTGILISWTQATNAVATNFLGSAISIHSGAQDSGLFGASIQPASIKPAKVVSLFRKLRGLSIKELAAMRTAIDRLNASWAWKALTDQAIDLGIALEVLLLHDNDRGELRYRLSERGAKLLGGNGPMQLENFRKLKAIYDLRSTAVHNGSVPDDDRTRETLTKAKDLCGKIANRIVKLGGFPSWEQDIIFRN